MSATAESPSRKRMHTIGAVCRHLQAEFPDISISKIRYLEDQGLLTPRRTQGGYRLYADEDVERLETILRLQRDEFLPLRVIRQELASPASAKTRRRRKPTALSGDEEELGFRELCERGGITPELAKELEEFGLLEPREEGSRKLYGAADAEVASVCAKLARYGVAPRHLRTFRHGADREAALLQQIVAPAVRSRNPERRQAGIEELQNLAELAQELSQLLFWRGLRHMAGS